MAAEVNEPGFFTLGLEAADAPRDSKELRLRIRRLTHWLPNLPLLHQTSIINLIGTLQCYAGEKCEAIESFNDVLTKDPDNVNALANLEAVYRSLMNTAMADEYMEKLREIEHDASSASPEVVGRQARCLAEQGHALAFDVTATREDVSKKAYSYYERALILGRDAFSSSEIISCRYNMALLKSRGLLKDKVDRDSMQDAYKEVLDLFSDILRKIEGAMYHADVWCNAGKLISKAAMLNTKYERLLIDMPTCINLEDVSYDATQCFEKAARLRPRDSDTRIEYGRWLCQTDKFEAALEQLNFSLKEDPSEANSYAYGVRAKTILQAVKKENMSPDRLNDAYNDAVKVVEWHCCSQSLQTLASICHQFAISPSAPDDKREYNRTRALQYFEQATHCEGGKEDPAIHALYGDCLRDFGELEGALKMYKKVIDYQLHSEPLRFKNFSKVLYAGFDVKRKRGENVLGPVMPEMKIYYDKMWRECSEADAKSVVYHLRLKGYGFELDQLCVNSSRKWFP